MVNLTRIQREELTSQADGEYISLAALLHNWHEIDPQNEGIKTAQILKKLADDQTGRLDAFREAITELCPTKGNDLPSVRSLSNKLRHFKGRVINGMALDAIHRNRFSFWCIKKIHPKSDSSDSFSAKGNESDESNESVLCHYADEKKSDVQYSSKKQYSEGLESDSLDSSDSFAKKITHKDPGCQSGRWWLHFSGDYYCQDCWPTTDPITVVENCEDCLK